MSPDSEGCVYKVLSTDNLIYGPIDLATLVQWVRERRVQRESWIHWESANDWVAAGSLEALQPEFESLADNTQPESAQAVSSEGLTVSELRGFERFAPFSNEELELLVAFSELVTANPGEVIIKEGDMSDSLFLVLSGQVRARIRVGGIDTVLGTMLPGELFGEVAMLSQTARSADVVADQPTRLLRLTSGRVQRLMADQPALAAKILFNIARLLATRISSRNVELHKDLAASFVWR